MYTKNLKYMQNSYRKKDLVPNAASCTGFGPKRKSPTLLDQQLQDSDQKNAQKVYAGYIGCSGLPLGEEQKYSKKKKTKKQKYQVYKIGLNSEKGKVSYHKKSESMTQTKMKQLINNKEISFQKGVEHTQNTPYTTKYSKQNLAESKGYHMHHHSVALTSPQYQNVVSSSTGSTRELKTVSSRVPKSKSKTKVNTLTGNSSPVHRINKDSISSDLSDKHAMSKTGKLKGHETHSIQHEMSSERYQTINDLLGLKKASKHVKAASMSNYHNSTEQYMSKPKMNAFNQKPTYIILTIDNSGDKGSVKKKETPKASAQTLTTASYHKQGQSYQQLSSLKKGTKKRPTHTRTKSDHVIKSKPSINFKLIKNQMPQDSKHAKNLQIAKSKMAGAKSNFTINPPMATKVAHSTGK